MLNREFNLTSKEATEAAINFVRNNWESFSTTETPLFLIVSTAEKKRRDRANRFYWGVVIKSIVEQAWVNGRQFHADVWHEYYASKFGIHKEMTLPNGKQVLKRLSTTEMSIKDFAEYTEKVTVEAASELAVRFPAQEFM